MKPEYDKYLCENFPLLYRDRHADMRTTCMCWGFCCGDGWFKLIRDLSAKLEPMIAALPEPSRSACRASQVKEKFGGLRFYLTTGTAEMHNAISEAQQKSYEICETCGQPGSGRERNGWYYVACGKHEKEPA